jgi:hypothetical protein
MIIKFLRTSFAALALATTTASALPVYPIDSKELFITSHQDPNFPIPRIGARGLEITFTPPASWSQISVKLRVSPNAQSLEDGTHLTVDATIATTAPGQSKATTILPWGLPKPSTHHDIPADIAPPGSEVFYRWEIQFMENGQPDRRIGDRHAFTMPRRVIVAILGDSFGSGEGAPSRVGSPWQPYNEGEAAHRSPISGQELAVKNFFAASPDIAYDFLNVSSSGAIASDIYSRVSQFQRNGLGSDDPSAAEGVRYIQRERLEEWLTARNYTSLDAIILSCGGNDLGFSTVLTNYLGLNRTKLKEAALGTLDDPFCIGLAATAFTASGGLFGNPFAILKGAGVYVACVVPKLVVNVYNAVQEDYSFATPYNAGQLSGNQYRNFPWYANRLETEYRNLSRNLNTGIYSGGRQVKPAQVFVTEYPFPLKDCDFFYETPPLISLVADTPLLDLGIGDLPGLSFVKSRKSFTFDLTQVRGLRVGFSRDETTEASNDLAPESSKPRPSFGGLNHLIQDHVATANASSSNTEWTFVKTGDFLPAQTGVAFAGAHFNTLTTAQNQVGPNIINNAYHPNQLGHEFTYQPAIRDALNTRVTPDHLAQRAVDEGLKAPTDPLPDLAFEIGTPTLEFLPGRASGVLTIHLTVVNRGNLSVAAGIPVSFELVARQNFKIPVENLPRLDINESHTIDLEFEIPLAAPITKQPFDCADEAYPGFEAYAQRDAALRYFFSDDQAELRIAIDPANTVVEINKFNNKASLTFDIPADDTLPGLVEAIQTVLSDLSALLARPINRVDFDLLVNEQQVRNYFGYYSPELDLNNRTAQQAYMDNALRRINTCFAHNFGITPPPPEPAPIPLDGLRPICLFPPTSGNCGSPGEALVRDALGQLTDIREISQNAPRDGRRVVIEAILSERFAKLFGTPTLPGFIDLPATIGGLKSPPEGIPLDLAGTRFVLQHLPNIENYSLSVGTQRGNSDLLPPTPLTRDHNSFDFSELPKDGRIVHATLTSYTDSGPQQSFYQFETRALNAALTSPNANQRLPHEGALIGWDHPNPALAGPVQSYSIAVGSYPGTSDVFPGVENTPIRRNTPEAINHHPIPATSNSFVLNNLPRDGRKLFITLGTLRDGEWEYEIHERFAAEAVGTGIRLPRPDREILARESFHLAPGRSNAESYRLLLGTQPGEGNIFSSPELTRETVADPIPVDLQEFVPIIDDQGRPFPVWATVITDGPTPTTESYGLIPSINASFLSPLPDELLPAGRPINFRWSPGVEAEGYRISVYSAESGDRPLYEETFDLSRRQADIPLDLTRDPVVVIFIETLRERNKVLETGANGSIYLIDQEVLNYYAGDGIDDTWQIHYFGHGNPNGLPLADPDGDGRNNLAEFLAGTDPTRPDAFPGPPVLHHADSGKPSAFLIPDPMPWTLFYLQESTTLGGWKDVSGPFSAAPGASELLLPIPQEDEPALFHRLRLAPRNP